MENTILQRFKQWIKERDSVTGIIEFIQIESARVENECAKIGKEEYLKMKAKEYSKFYKYLMDNYYAFAYIAIEDAYGSEADPALINFCEESTIYEETAMVNNIFSTFPDTDKTQVQLLYNELLNCPDNNLISFHFSKSKKQIDVFMDYNLPEDELDIGKRDLFNKCVMAFPERAVIIIRTVPEDKLIKTMQITKSGNWRSITAEEIAANIESRIPTD